MLIAFAPKEPPIIKRTGAFGMRVEKVFSDRILEYFGVALFAGVVKAGYYALGKTAVEFVGKSERVIGFVAHGRNAELFCRVYYRHSHVAAF